MSDKSGPLCLEWALEDLLTDKPMSVTKLFGEVHRARGAGVILSAKGQMLRHEHLSSALQRLKRRGKAKYAYFYDGTPAGWVRPESKP